MVTLPMVSPLHAALLVAVLAILAWRTIHDRHRMDRFRKLTDTADRQRVFLRWTAQSFAAFACGGIAILALIGRVDSLLRFPSDFAPLAPSSAHAIDGDALAGMLVGMTAGAMSVFVVWRYMLGKRSQPVIGNVAALFPRNRAECLVLTPLAINAGLAEEIFFRLVLPLLATEATGSAHAGFAIAAVTFGLMHWYQGWKGVLLTGLMSLPFIGLYMASRSLLVPIVAHAAIDLLVLVVRPGLGLWLDRRNPQPA